MTTDDRIGVLLVNLGSPESTDFWSVHRFLKEFLSDPRVVEVPRLLWWPVLNGIILTTRPGKSGAKYERIWDRNNNCSPLLAITKASSEKLAARLEADHGAHFTVDYAMRYGAPAIKDQLEQLMAQGCMRILVFPLYPQYSATTTATVVDAVGAALKTMRHQPTLHFVPPYYSDEAHIEALAHSLERHLKALDFTPERLLVSFHGIPQDYADKGDPYPRHCEITFDLLRKRLQGNGIDMAMTYQSRFGPRPWLQPYTDETIEKLAGDGIMKLAVAMPGFATDCLETLEEIAIENAEIFKRNGGKRFAALPCLNDSEEAIDMMQKLVEREVQGWF